MPAWGVEWNHNLQLRVPDAQPVELSDGTSNYDNRSRRRHSKDQQWSGPNG